MCFHTGMTSGFIWDLGTAQERQATQQETVDILKDIDTHFRHHIGDLIYRHHWWAFQNVALCNLYV